MIEPIGTDNSSFAPEALEENGFGKDAFFKLLITELTNQNPFSPGDSKDFISQLTQFSSLEQLRSLNNTLASLGEIYLLSQATQFIGYRVEAESPLTGETIEGIVKEVVWQDKVPYLAIGNVLTPVSWITKITSNQ